MFIDRAKLLVLSKRCLVVLVLVSMLVCSADAASGKQKTWTDPVKAAKEDPDFLIQGEYGSAIPGEDYGVQVVALGGGNFEAYVLEGGLPGLGWTRKKGRSVLKGSRDGDKITFVPFSKKNIPINEKISGTISGGKFNLVLPLEEKMLAAGKFGGRLCILDRIERKSTTLGAKPPKGAIVLFDGSSADKWKNGKVKDGHLQATGATSKQVFTDYSLHLEFRTPYMPTARGQGRGNSGIYHSGRWETQVLDSFGLEGRDNEAGGIYSVSKPRLNMCLPPLSWQTYDVDFKAAKFDADGKRTAWPRITVKLNGVVVHDDLELDKNFTTAAPIHSELVNGKGPIFLQNHANPVVYRNIWVTTPKDAKSISEPQSPVGEFIEKGQYHKAMQALPKAMDDWAKYTKQTGRTAEGTAGFIWMMTLSNIAEKGDADWGKILDDPKIPYSYKTEMIFEILEARLGKGAVYQGNRKNFIFPRLGVIDLGKEMIKLKEK